MTTAETHARRAIDRFLRRLRSPSRKPGNPLRAMLVDDEMIRKPKTRAFLAKGFYRGQRVGGW